jgi:hypothetical protein
MASDDRLTHLMEFYTNLDALERNVGGARTLADCAGRLTWPRRGVYFFREAGELRSDSGGGPRIVRVGTHALREGGSTRLWTRLSQHKGQAGTGGGNHRGSIFRLIIGSSLIAQSGHNHASWGKGNTAAAEVKKGEEALEREVSTIIGKMPFLWLGIDDEAGPHSLRGYIERNAIALLSNYGKQCLDPASGAWLGQYCDRERVRRAGLWNSNHVEECYDPAFLGCLRQLVSAAGSAS